MLKSMTGYGEATIEAENFVLSVELKSVNNRFIKDTSKITEEVSYLQNDLEEEIRKYVLRGTVALTVRFEPTRYVDLYEIDEEVLKKYLRILNKIKEELKSSERIELKDLLLLPGVVHTEEALILGKHEVLPVALRALNGAVESLVRMRGLEGSHLETEFRKRAGNVHKFLEKVKQEAPRAVEEYRQKLEDRVNQLLSQKGVSLEPGELLKEVAILADRWSFISPE